ncbi:MAG: DUF1638 domain-containing protein [Methanophagales archaeon ANME-1-THS]|nr:MAG: DUF1638 domain-containing protein [Methanophagales archaeon ANME-1-THS]
MHIGIITCEILRKEIQEVLKKSGVNELFFVLPETTNSVITVQHQTLIDRFSSEFAADGFRINEQTLEKIKREIRDRHLEDSVIVKVLELRMHDYPDQLRAEIEESITTMSSVVDCILLGYGLCGITAGAMERVINEAPVPVFIPRHRDGTILNNCIEIALGREKVQSLLEEEVGTFFMSPVGAALIKEPQVILESSINIIAGRMNRHAATDTPRIIKLMKNHYYRVVKIWYSEADKNDEEYRRTVENFARTFNLEIKLVNGSARIMCELLDAVKFT